MYIYIHRIFVVRVCASLDCREGVSAKTTQGRRRWRSRPTEPEGHRDANDACLADSRWLSMFEFNQMKIYNIMHQPLQNRLWLSDERDQPSLRTRPASTANTPMSCRPLLPPCPSLNYHFRARKEKVGSNLLEGNLQQ